MGVCGGIGRPGRGLCNAEESAGKAGSEGCARRPNPYTRATEGPNDRDPKQPERSEKNKTKNKREVEGGAKAKSSKGTESSGRDFDERFEEKSNAVAV